MNRYFCFFFSGSLFLLSSFTSLSTSFVCAQALAADFSTELYRNQLYQNVYERQWGNFEDGAPLYYKVQNANGSELYLGPNEVFFKVRGNLSVGGATNNSTLDLNAGKEYSYIKNFSSNTSIAEWAFLSEKAGDLALNAFFDVPTEALGTTLALTIDNSYSFSIVLDDSLPLDTNGKRVFSAQLTGLAHGTHQVKLSVTTPKSATAIKLYAIVLSGSAIENTAYVVRERWRPNAAYSNFKSTQSDLSARAWIFEIYSDAELGHFSPITTPFGYFGPVFDSNNVASGVNMSLWSYGANDSPPPLEQWSHLLGIGSSKGYFDGFTGEGVGVKVRDWNMFDTNTSKKYVYGLRYENDGLYTTYYGYFWNEETSAWQLFSVGRKYANKEVTGLKTNGFIEVPGAAEVERTNQIERRLYYRGWINLGENNSDWYDLDTLTTTSAKSGVTNKRWGVSEDGERFFCSAGGLIQRDVKDIPATFTKEIRPIEQRPDFMQWSNLEKIFTLPFKPEIISATYQDGSTYLQIQPNTPNAVDITLCWGAQDALTLEDQWDHCDTFQRKAGKASRTIGRTLSTQPEERFFRVLVRDGTAQMWNFETYEIPVAP